MIHGGMNTSKDSWERELKPKLVLVQTFEIYDSFSILYIPTNFLKTLIDIIAIVDKRITELGDIS